MGNIVHPPPVTLGDVGPCTDIGQNGFDNVSMSPSGLPVDPLDLTGPANRPARGPDHAVKSKIRPSSSACSAWLMPRKSGMRHNIPQEGAHRVRRLQPGLQSSALPRSP